MVQGKVTVQTVFKGDIRTNKILSIETDMGRICVAGAFINTSKKLKPHGIGWIKDDKLLQIVNTKWIIVGGTKKRSILYMVQLNLNPINLFWIVFWKLYYKMDDKR